MTKTVFGAFRGTQPLFHSLFGVKTLSGTLLAPPLMKKGYGARCDQRQLMETVTAIREDQIKPEEHLFIAQILYGHGERSRLQLLFKLAGTETAAFDFWM